MVQMMIVRKGLRSFNIFIWDAICVPFCVFNNKINGKFEVVGNLKAFGAYGDKAAVLALQGYTENIDNQYNVYKLILRENGGGFSHQIGSQSTKLWDIALKSDLSWKHLVNVTTTNPITVPDSANEIFLETLIRKGESYFFDNRVLGKINKGAYQVIRFLFDGYSYHMVNEMGSVHFSNFKVGNDTPDEFLVAVRYR